MQKVLASWRKEKIFSEAIIDQCAANIGLTITKSGMLLAPSGDVDYTADGNEINIASPALSAFSEPSAGSVDLAGLDSFPPNTVASANIEPPRYCYPFSHTLLWCTGFVSGHCVLTRCDSVAVWQIVLTADS